MNKIQKEILAAELINKVVKEARKQARDKETEEQSQLNTNRR